MDPIHFSALNLSPLPLFERAHHAPCALTEFTTQSTNYKIKNKTNPPLFLYAHCAPCPLSHILHPQFLFPSTHKTSLFSLSDFKSSRETATTCPSAFNGGDGECFHNGDRGRRRQVRVHSIGDVQGQPRWHC